MLNCFVIELRIVLSDTEELLELIRLFDRRNHQKVLKIALKNVSPVNGLIATATNRWPTSWNRHANTAGDVWRFLEFIEASLGKLITALRKLDARILVN